MNFTVFNVKVCCEVQRLYYLFSNCRRSLNEKTVRKILIHSGTTFPRAQEATPPARPSLNEINRYVPRNIVHADITSASPIQFMYKRKRTSEDKNHSIYSRNSNIHREREREGDQIKNRAQIGHSHCCTESYTIMPSMVCLPQPLAFLLFSIPTSTNKPLALLTQGNSRHADYDFNKPLV